MHPWAIRRRLGPDGPAWKLICLDEVGSTNDVARRAGDRGLPERLAVFADLQTAGRGRVGRHWEVPAGRGVLCSTLWRPRVTPDRAPALAQFVGVACRRALAALGVDAELKWPNDLLLGGHKCGGILIENAIEGDALTYAVVGVGLNVLQREDELLPTPYPATSISIATGRVPDRAALAAELLRELARQYEQWLANPMAVFGDWRASLVTLGQLVEVTGPDGHVRGRAIDVEPDGRLVLRREDGAIVRIVSGEASFRA